RIYVYKPDGSYLTSDYFNETSYASGTLDLVNVHASGTYTVFVSPYRTSTGQIAIAVKQDASDALAIDGMPSDVTLAAGQNARGRPAGLQQEGPWAEGGAA